MLNACHTIAVDTPQECVTLQYFVALISPNYHFLSFVFFNSMYSLAIFVGIKMLPNWQFEDLLLVVALNAVQFLKSLQACSGLQNSGVISKKADERMKRVGTGEG